MASQLLPPYLTATTVTVTVDGVPETIVQTTLVTSVLPTQALPSFLSASTFTTVIGGVSATAVSTVGVPLTYSGPSIPLGPDDVWTFASSSSTAPTATSASNTSPSATPSSQTATPTAITSSASAGTGTPLSSSTSSKSSVAPFPTGASPKGLTKAQRDGIILAAVVAGIIIISLINLLLWRCLRRRGRRSARDGLGDFVIVDSEGQVRYAGEGVPRPTGGEEDSFLRRGNTNTANVMREVNPPSRLISRRGPPSPTGSDITTGTISPPEGVIPIAVSRTPDRPSSPPLSSKVQSPFFHASASSSFFQPTRGADFSMARKGTGAQRLESMSTRGDFYGSSGLANISENAPPHSSMQLGESWQQDLHGYSAGNNGIRSATELGQQRLSLQPAHHLRSTLLSMHTSHPASMRTTGSHPDTVGSDDERATLLTARRVNMNEGGPGTMAYADQSGVSPSSWSSSLGLGLGGLKRLSRLSWFQRLEVIHSHSPDNQNPQSSPSEPASPEQVPHPHTPSPAPPPTSHTTISSSGETAYYDAPSSFSTHSGNRADNSVDYAGRRPRSLPHVPPRAMTTMNVNSASHSMPPTPTVVQHNTGSDTGSADRPALLLLTALELPSSSSPPLGGNLGTITTRPGAEEQEFNPHTQEPFDIDILDTPAPLPAAMSPFSTSSSRGGANRPVLPPGLDLAHVHAWRESSSDMPSSATFGEGSEPGIEVELDLGMGTAMGVGDDALEDAPPLPRARWALLRSVMTSTAASSTRSLAQKKLDVPNVADDHSSHVGSLHSIPNIPSERLSPYSTMASQPGSSASGSRSGQYSASRSRSGGSHSRNSGGSRSGSNSQHSYSRSRPRSRGGMSVASDGLLRPRREGGLRPLTPPSVASSAGSNIYQRPRLSAFGSSRTSTTPQRSPAADATFAAAVSSKIPQGTGTVLGRRM